LSPTAPTLACSGFTGSSWQAGRKKTNADRSLGWFLHGLFA